MSQLLTTLTGASGEALTFGGTEAVITSLDFGAPATRRPVTSLSGGGALPGAAIPGTRRVVLTGVLLPSGTTEALRKADGFRLRRLLCRITDPESPFVLTRDELSLTLYADGGPRFSTEAPLAGPDAFGFILTADAYDPFFRCPQTPVVWQIEAGQTAGVVSVSSAGDVRCGGIFTVTAGDDADGFRLTLRNRTSGEEFRMSTGLSAGETAILDTRPGHRGLSIAAGAALSDGLIRMDWTCDFPTFLPGVNQLFWQVTGSGSAGVSLVLHPGWLSA